MFNKLLSNLPFNPSLINQVSFYSKRLKQEASVRRLGFSLVALTMFVQLFAVLSPAQPSLAQSGNDLIPGGFSSKSEAVKHCLLDAEYRAILAHFAISCTNLQENSQVTTVRSDTAKNGQPLYSMGRQPQGPINGTTGRATNEVAVNVAGVASPFYMRLLSSWDKRVPSTYQALSVGNAFDIQFYILFTCGNIVEFGPPPKPAPKPVPKPPAPKPKPTPKSSISCDSLTVSSTQVKPNEAVDLVAQATKQNAKIISYNFKVNGASKQNTASNKYTFSQIKDGTYTVSVTVHSDHGDASSAACIVKIDVKSNPKPPPKPCAASTSPIDVDSCIKISKQATNTTQNIVHANNTTAKAGDIIKYSLITKNTAIVPARAYVVEDNFSDILDYANFVSLDGATNTSGVLTWPATDIAAGGTLTKVVTVRVKDPIPKTPQPCNPALVHPCPLTGSFDLTMTNVYGNVINIKVQPPVEKTVEIVTTQTLTNTGPGSSLIIGFSITTVVGYFFARSRMMSRELDIVRAEYTSGGL